MTKVFGRWRQATVTLASVAAIIFGLLNAIDEQQPTDFLIRFSLDWAIGPLAVLVVYFLSVRVTKDPAVNDTEAITLSLMYAIVHAQYAFNGPSWRNGPDNAAQMHLILVPLMLGFPVFFIVLYMLWTMVRTARKAKREDIYEVVANTETPPKL